MPAPDHAPIQGHQFTNKQWERLQNHQWFMDVDYKDPYHHNRFSHLERVIGQYNCRHFAYSIIIGVNKPNYTQEQLDEINRQNEEGYTDKTGKHYTKYECSQKMREMETEIRRHKERYLSFQESGDEKSAKEERATVSQLVKEYKAFCQACGLTPQMDRCRVAGYK